MSQVEELIKDLCPNGVEFKYLWELTTWDKKFNAVDNKKQPKVIKYHYLLASELRPLIKPKGNVKLLTTNTTDFWTTEEDAADKLSKGEIIAIPWGGNPNVQYFKGKFLTADNRIATSNDTSVLNNKFLYYYMLNNIESLGTFYRGSGIKHPNMAKVLDMRIPLPPIVVQQEIVKILDAFSEFGAELETELEARKLQLEAYRNKLMNFPDDMKRMMLIDACDYVDYRGKTPRKTSEGIFLVTAKNIRRGYIDYESSREYISPDDYEVVMRRGLPEIGDVLITTEAPCGHVAQVDRKNIALAQRVIKYRSKSESLDNSFLKHYMLSNRFQKDLDKAATGSTVKGIKGSKLHKLTIPIPSVTVQNKIVSILDDLETLVNDVSVGIPAEINARKKQYRYYRNKFLTFQEL